MKKNFTIILLATLAIFLYNSCSISKRYHNRGFHIDFNFNSKGLEKFKQTNKTQLPKKETKNAIEFTETLPYCAEEFDHSEVILEKESLTNKVTEFEKTLETNSENKIKFIVKSIKKSKKQKSKARQKDKAVGAVLFGTSIVCFLAALLCWLLGILFLQSGSGCLGVILAATMNVLAITLAGVGALFFIIWLVVIIVKSVRKSNQSESPTDV